MPSASPAYSATIQVEDRSYEYRGAEISYEVYVDSDETIRYVVGGIRNSDGSSVGRTESKTVRLKPGLIDRLRERVSGFEFEPIPYEEQVALVTDRLESVVDEAREIQDRHSNDVRITRVNGEPVPEDESPTVDVTIGDDGGDSR